MGLSALSAQFHCHPWIFHHLSWGGHHLSALETDPGEPVLGAKADVAPVFPQVCDLDLTEVKVGWHDEGSLNKLVAASKLTVGSCPDYYLYDKGFYKGKIYMCVY